MPLTDVKIRQAKATDKALKLADTAGLYLEVKPNGSKLWRYRYRIAGRENLYAIGDYPSVSLADARKARDDARDLIKLGRHPAHARQSERTQQINANALTFKAIAEEWIAKKRSRWAPYSTDRQGATSAFGTSFGNQLRRAGTHPAQVAEPGQLENR